MIYQHDVQRAGGLCSRYPVSCLVYRLVEDVVGLPLRILDLCYGEGRFWRVFPRRRIYLVGFDIKRLPWHVEPDEFYEYPSWRWSEWVDGKSFDLVVADPPWTKYRVRRMLYISPIEGIDRQVLSDAVKAATHYDAYLLIHWKRRYVPQGFEVASEFWFQGRTHYANLSRPSWFGILKRDK